MELLEDCQEFFGTKDLYKILNIDKSANQQQIASAYRLKSLKVHPDRVPDSHKKTAKEAFQTLTKVVLILSNEDSRKIYDETGKIITDDNRFDDSTTFEEFNNFLRTLFPKINFGKLDEFAKKYIGSKEEEEDLKRLYLQFKGNLDSIYANHLYYDEDRVQNSLKKLIESKEIPAFDAFVNEPKAKKQKRLRKIAKEKTDAEKAAKQVKEPDSDLVTAIQKRANNFDQMISNLESKYSKKSKRVRK